MARKFSIPTVAEMLVGETRTLPICYGEANRKIPPYAARNGKAFALTRPDKGYAPTTVTRLPDPEPRAE